MKKEDIQPWDWQRILFGEAPPEFLVEVFVRTFIIYIALLIIVRLMGKRMGGQLTVSELAVMVTLGAIVSPAMQIPQLGVLMGILILICALIFQRGLNLTEMKDDAEIFFELHVFVFHPHASSDNEQADSVRIGSNHGASPHIFFAGGLAESIYR